MVLKSDRSIYRPQVHDTCLATLNNSSNDRHCHSYLNGQLVVRVRTFGKRLLYCKTLTRWGKAFGSVPPRAQSKEWERIEKTTTLTRWGKAFASVPPRAQSKGGKDWKDNHIKGPNAFHWPHQIKLGSNRGGSIPPYPPLWESLAFGLLNRINPLVSVPNYYIVMITKQVWLYLSLLILLGLVESSLKSRFKNVRRPAAGRENVRGLRQVAANQPSAIGLETRLVMTTGPL